MARALAPQRSIAATRTKRIHDSGQHAHGVRRGARQAIFGHLGAAQDIAAADHDAEIDTEIVGGDQIGGKTIDRRLVNTELFGTA